MRTAIALALIFGSPVLSHAAELEWRNAAQLEAAVQRAQLEQTPVLLHFTADWCAPCQALKDRAFRDKRVIQELHHWTNIEIDVDRYPHLAERFGVKAVPFDVYLRSDGTPIAAHASPQKASDYAATLTKSRSLANPSPSPKVASADSRQHDWPTIRQPQAR